MPESYLQEEYPGTQSSFRCPVPAPTVDPDVGPFVCWQVPTAYVQVVLGALFQLQQPFAWRAIDDDARRLTLNRMDTLISDLAAAGTCAEAGVISVTIPMGSATGSAAVTFPTPFAAAPVVVVSCDNPDLIASWSAVSTTGFTAVLTANVNLPAEVTATVSWQAMAAS